MKGLKKLLLTAFFSLGALGLCLGNATAPTATATSDFNCTYTAMAKTDPYVYYGSTEVKTYTAEEAAAKGIPAGYEGEVLEVLGSENRGFLVDFSSQQIPFDMVESLEFRVYLGYSSSNSGIYPQVRIPKPYQFGNWVWQEQESTPVGEWTTVSVPYTKENFSSLGENGVLNKFEFCVRSKASIDFYIDSIGYTLKKPTITFTGSENVTVSLGKGLYVPATATDALGNVLDIEYIWDDGVELNANGTPTQMGTYNLTLKAVDSYGGVATKTVTVSVEEGDNVAPEISLNFSTVKTTVGTKPMLSVTATDNNGAVTLEKIWSDGALDNRGRLTEGTHTWTIKATDKYGNTTTKTVTFIVTATEPAYSMVTDEGDIFGDCTVTFDGVNPISVGYGFKVSKPADPVKEDTAAARYTFIGWYNGDELWDFSTDVVTSDLDLQSKWQETKRVYRVEFDGKSAGKVEYGEKIPASMIPADPTKPSNTRFEYTFAGWYNGDTPWDFETDVVTGDVSLTPKFTESPRLYTVTFDGENATQYGYGSKIEKPVDPEKAPTATHRYEFLGWFNGDMEWNFAINTVKYHLNLQSKWREIEIEVEEPAMDSDSTVQQDSDSTQQGDDAQGGINDLLAGCTSVVGGLTGTIVALGLAAVAMLKKKED